MGALLSLVAGMGRKFAENAPWHVLGLFLDQQRLLFHDLDLDDSRELLRSLAQSESLILTAAPRCWLHLSPDLASPLRHHQLHFACSPLPVQEVEEVAHHHPSPPLQR